MTESRRAFLKKAGVGVATSWVAPTVVTLRTPAAAASGDPPPAPSPVLLGTHPQAAAQSTVWGKRIQELIVFDGIVFAGFGDWDANTGPIAASGWDIASASWVNESSPGTLDTESTWIYRRVGNRLVVPFIDPKTNTGDLAVRSEGSSTWTTLPIGAGTAGTIHAFDVATFDGTDLWVAGAKRGVDDASVWRSPSGLGGDWVEALTYTPPAGSFARYIQLVNAFGKLYTSGYYADGVNPSVSLAGEAWDGTSWVAAPEFTFDGTNHRRGHRPMVFDSQVVRTSTWPLSLNPSPPPTYLFPARSLLWFDGTSLTVGSELALHHNLDDSGNLWWIDDTLAVQRRPPGGPTQFVVQAPVGASALAVDGSDLYIGTSSSELYLVAGI